MKEISKTKLNAKKATKIDKHERMTTGNEENKNIKISTLLKKSMSLQIKINKSLKDKKTMR